MPVWYAIITVVCMQKDFFGRGAAFYVTSGKESAALRSDSIPVCVDELLISGDVSREVVRCHVNYLVPDTRRWEQSAGYLIDPHS
jgi:hypothetical protein